MSSSFPITAVLYQLNFPFPLYILALQTTEVLTLPHSSQHPQELGMGAATIWAFCRDLF